METTIREFTKRLEKLEIEVRAIRDEHAGRRVLPRPKHPLTSAEWGAIAMEDAERNADFYSQLFAETLTEMGIVGEPTSGDELFKLYEEAGFDPESTEFAQGIVAMRDEG
jgi:hypothetical protein